MLDHSNQFIVAGDTAAKVRILRPPYRGEPLTAEQALNLAAWLVAIADPSCRQFARMLRLVTENGVNEEEIQGVLGLKS
jgi:hypothetical protein